MRLRFVLLSVILNFNFRRRRRRKSIRMIYSDIRSQIRDPRRLRAQMAHPIFCPNRNSHTYPTYVFLNTFSASKFLSYVGIALHFRLSGCLIVASIEVI